MCVLGQDECSYGLNSNYADVTKEFSVTSVALGSTYISILF